MPESELTVVPDYLDKVPYFFSYQSKNLKWLELVLEENQFQSRRYGDGWQ